MSHFFWPNTLNDTEKTAAVAFYRLIWVSPPQPERKDNFMLLSGWYLLGNALFLWLLQIWMFTQELNFRNR